MSNSKPKKSKIPRNKSLEIVINGYITEDIKDELEFVPSDITKSIENFISSTCHKFHINSCFIMVTEPQFNYNSDDDDEYSHQQSQTSISNLSTHTNTSITDHQWNYENIRCTINPTSLPTAIQSKLKISDTTNNTKEWSMFFQNGDKHNEYNLYSDKCSLTSFNINTNELKSVKLPTFPIQIREATSVYCEQTKTIYSLHSDTVYSLDLDWKVDKAKDEYENGWGWNIFSGNLKHRRTNTCSCVVDNKFIAIMGGERIAPNYDYKGYQILDDCDSMELFAINSKQSIWLKDIQSGCDNRSKAVYHGDLYKIIVGEGNYCDVYDINKNEWMNVEERRMNDDEYGDEYLYDPHVVIMDLWTSLLEPNVVYLARKRRGRLQIETFDLRVMEMVDIEYDAQMGDDCKILSLFHLRL